MEGLLPVVNSDVQHVCIIIVFNVVLSAADN